MIVNDGDQPAPCSGGFIFLASGEFASQPEGPSFVSDQSNQDVKGRTALVTGSTSGIGLGVAKALVAAGANVMVNGRTPKGDVSAILDEIRGAGDGQVDYVSADLSQATEVARLVEETTTRLGAPDILVNNAGVQHVSPLEDFPAEKWELIISLNLSAAFHSTKACLGHMKTQGWGRIINVSSAHGIVASPFKSAYVAAKHGLNGLTKVTALEAAETGVTCNAICPGYVWTPLVAKQIDDQAKSHNIPKEDVIRDIILKPQPNKQFATVEEIGALTVFLCGMGGRSITGASLPVDGGWTAH